MSLLMDALRRAETQEREQPATADNEPQAAVAETAAAALELEPLRPATDSGVLPGATPDAADAEQGAVAQTQNAVVAPARQPPRDASHVYAPAATSPLKKQLGYFFTAGVTVVLVVGGYYLWRSNQVIHPANAYSETLIDVPVLPEPAQAAMPLPSLAEPTPAPVAEPLAATRSADNELPQDRPLVDDIPAAIEASPSSRIEIRKSQTIRSVHPLLQQAYSAYRQQDYAQAEQLYRQAAKRYPGNRDALLGLAGIAMHQGNLRAARYYYESLLKAHPGDKIARIALQSLTGGDDSLQESSQIKHWLQTDRNNAQLHFALGNRYAQSGQWQEAQSAYFDAVSIDPEVPDYTFNLAVSLDQLGLYEQALVYYRKARELSNHSSGLFSLAQLDNRIGKLETLSRRVTP